MTMNWSQLPDIRQILTENPVRNIEADRAGVLTFEGEASDQWVALPAFVREQVRPCLLLVYRGVCFDYFDFNASMNALIFTYYDAAIDERGGDAILITPPTATPTYQPDIFKKCLIDKRLEGQPRQQLIDFSEH